MKNIIIIFLLFSTSIFSLDDVEYYNFQIKNELTLEYAPEIIVREKKHRKKRWDEILLDQADNYIDEKHAQYEAAKKRLEEDLTNNLNRTIVPPTMAEDLIVIVTLDEDPQEIKIIYHYISPILPIASTDFGLEEEQLKFTFNIGREFSGLESPISIGVVSIFEFVNRKVEYIF